MNRIRPIGASAAATKLGFVISRGSRLSATGTKTSMPDDMPGNAEGAMTVAMPFRPDRTPSLIEEELRRPAAARAPAGLMVSSRKVGPSFAKRRSLESRWGAERFGKAGEIS